MDPADIVVKAVQDLYTTITLSPRPPMWADKVPINNTGGVVQTLPYVVVRGFPLGAMDWMNELDRIELVRVTLNVFGLGKALVAGYVDAIMFNGAAPNARAGFDDATALTLPAGYSLNKMERQSPGIVKLEDMRGPNAELVFSSELVYDVELFRDGDLGT